MDPTEKPDLEVRCDGMTYSMDRVGSWSWQKGENGSITLTASPPGVEPVATAPETGRKRGFGSNSSSGNTDLGKKLIGAITPSLQAKADELKASASISMEAARVAAAEKAAAEEQATPTRGAPPEDES